MYHFFDHIYNAAYILTESGCNVTSSELKTILEDNSNPVTKKYVEKLYDNVLSRAHVDFDDIPKSAGDIRKYSGFPNMIEVLSNINGLAMNDKAKDVLTYVATVQTAIENVKGLAPAYMLGFKTGSEYVIMDYNVIVYTIIQAVSSILYNFVDYMRSPTTLECKIVLKNTKYAAYTFYIEQLIKFNKVCSSMKYSDYLLTIAKKPKDKFTGDELLGIGAVVGLALAIVPIMRETVYRVYKTRNKISEALAQQAYFLELNKTVVENNSAFTKEKKSNIIIKQEKIRQLLLRLSNSLKVNHVKDDTKGKNDIKDSNKLLTLDNVKREADNDHSLLLM